MRGLEYDISRSYCLSCSHLQAQHHLPSFGADPDTQPSLHHNIQALLQQTSTFTDFLPMPQWWYHPQTMVVCIRGIPFHCSIPCQQHRGGQGDTGPGSVGHHLALQDLHLGHRKERWQGRWMGRDRQKNTPGSRTTFLTDHPADQS